MLPDLRAVIAATIATVGLLMIAFGAVAALRVAQDHHGALQADLARRVRIAELPPPAHTPIMVIDTPGPHIAPFPPLPVTEIKDAPIATELHDRPGPVADAPSAPPPAAVAALPTAEAPAVAPAAAPSPAAAPPVGGPLAAATPPSDAERTAARAEHARKLAAAKRARAARLARQRKAAAARRAAQARARQQQAQQATNTFNNGFNNSSLGSGFGQQPQAAARQPRVRTRNNAGLNPASQQ